MPSRRDDRIRRQCPQKRRIGRRAASPLGSRRNRLLVCNPGQGRGSQVLAARACVRIHPTHQARPAHTGDPRPRLGYKQAAKLTVDLFPENGGRKTEEGEKRRWRKPALRRHPAKSVRDRSQSGSPPLGKGLLRNRTPSLETVCDFPSPPFSRPIENVLQVKEAPLDTFAIMSNTRMKQFGDLSQLLRVALQRVSQKGRKGRKGQRGHRGQIALGGFLRLPKAPPESLLAFSTFWTP